METPTPIATPGQAVGIAQRLQDLPNGIPLIATMLFLLAAAVILMPLALRGRDNRFFRISYITWYLLRSSIAALSIIAIVTLGLAEILSGEVISALFGSLLGYVLGSTSRGESTRPNPPSPLGGGGSGQANSAEGALTTTAGTGSTLQPTGAATTPDSPTPKE